MTDILKVGDRIEIHKATGGIAVIRVDDRVTVRKDDSAIRHVGCEKVILKTSFKGPQGPRGENGLDGAPIDDAVIDIDRTWSSIKIAQAIQQSVVDIMGSAPEALDTLQELAAAISNNPSFADDLMSLMGSDEDFASIFEDGLL